MKSIKILCAYWYDPFHNRSTLLCYVLTFLLSVPVLAQKKRNDWKLKMSLKEQNVAFEMPAGYAEYDAGFNYECRDGQNANGLVYSIANKDSSIRIAFAFSPHPSAEVLSGILRVNPGWKAEENYRKTIKALADTINDKVVFYEDSIAAKNNADVVASFSRNCRIPVLGRYAHNRFFIFKKLTRGHFEVVYFYTDAANAVIQREIERTRTMLKFL